MTTDFTQINNQHEFSTGFYGVSRSDIRFDVITKQLVLDDHCNKPLQKLEVIKIDHKLKKKLRKLHKKSDNKRNICLLNSVKTELLIEVLPAY